jgi:hypothetical protein
MIMSIQLLILSALLHYIFLSLLYSTYIDIINSHYYLEPLKNRLSTGVDYRNVVN